MQLIIWVQGCSDTWFSALQVKAQRRDQVSYSIDVRRIVHLSMPPVYVVVVKHSKGVNIVRST